MLHRNTTKIFLIFFNLIFVFTSCDHFLNGSDTKKQLDKAIAYANASTYTIMVDYPEGTGVLKSPAGGIAELKETDTITINFESFTDYAFVSWKITDFDTGKEIPNDEYLTLDSLTNSETKCTLNKIPEDRVNLVINVIVAERPQIISYFPSSSNIMRDCSIEVLFDRNMDPYSIYYTEKEIMDLKKDTNITLLTTTLENGSSEIYGYCKESDIVFKNISIKNKITNENLAEYFDTPILEGSTLTIPAKKDNPPPGYTQILVTLEKGFYYSVEDSNQINTNSIELAGSKKWMYQLNNKTDKKSMTPEKDENGTDCFTVKLGTTELKSLTNSYALTWPVEGYNDSTHINTNFISSIKNDNMFFLDENMDVSKIYLSMSLEDEMGSGPKPNFNIKLQRLTNADYVVISENNRTIVEVSIDYLNVSFQEAFFEGDFVLGNLLKDDGVYLLVITCEDKSNNPFVKHYFFARDTNPPPAYDIERVVNEYGHVKYRWKKPAWDCVYTHLYVINPNGVIHEYNGNSMMPDVQLENINGVDYFTMDLMLRFDEYLYYDVYVDYEDYAGHKTISNTSRITQNGISH